jgi:hypothetical protein
MISVIVSFVVGVVVGVALHYWCVQHCVEPGAEPNMVEHDDVAPDVAEHEGVAPEAAEHDDIVADVAEHADVVAVAELTPEWIIWWKTQFGSKHHRRPQICEGMRNRNRNYDLVMSTGPICPDDICKVCSIEEHRAMSDSAQPLDARRYVAACIV